MDLNPYESPKESSVAGSTKSHLKRQLVLEPDTIAEMRGLINDGTGAITFAIIGCFCVPISVAFVPYYVLRLRGWYRLVDQNPEVVTADVDPNSVHGRFIANFRHTKFRLAMAIVVGVFYLVATVVFWATPLLAGAR